MAKKAYVVPGIVGV